jgi:hypothetical protein
VLFGRGPANHGIFVSVVGHGCAYGVLLVCRFGNETRS